MTVTVKFSCMGCGNKIDGTAPLTTAFQSICGRRYGIGTFSHTKQPQSVIPEGWIAFDPYDGNCYCPKCWKEMVGLHGRC